MKLHPILFSTPMVDAILAGTKTQTRRVIKPKIGTGAFDVCMMLDGTITDVQAKNEHDERIGTVHCPYGYEGDTIWVRETWRIVHINHNSLTGSFYTVQFKDYFTYSYSEVQHLQEYLKNRFNRFMMGPIGDAYGPWKPSLFLPLTLCRVFLEIESVGVEWLQDISEADALAEGIGRIQVTRACSGAHQEMRYQGYMQRHGQDINHPLHRWTHTAKASYQTLWEKINGPESWASNPFVWVVEFKRVEKPAV